MGPFGKVWPRGTAARGIAVAVALAGVAALLVARHGLAVAGDAHAHDGAERRFTWTPGRQSTYAVRWEAASRRDVPGGDEAKQLGGTSTFEGDVTVRCVRPEADGAFTLAYGIDAVRAYDVSLDTGDLLSDEQRRLASAALRGQEAFARVDTRGQVESIAYHHETPASTRELLRHLVEMMRVTLPEQGRPTSWSAEEPTPNGLAHVRYEDEGNALQRVRLAYQGGVVGASGAEGRHSLSSTATITLDEHGALQGIDDREVLEAHGPTGDVTSQWRFLARRSATLGFDPRAARLDDLDEATGASELARERQRGRDERLSKGWDLGSIEVQLSVYGRGTKVDPKFVPSAAAFVRLRPEAATHLVSWFRDARMTDLGRQLVFDVLSAAGSAEAQEAMRSALDTPEGRNPAVRGDLVQRFVFVREPTPESARFVADLYDGARASGDTRVAFRAAASLGAIVEHLQGADDLAAEIDARLRTDLAQRRSPLEEVALLLALGNARQEDDLPAIAAFAGDREATVREQVARSLRYYDDATASSALLDLVRDDTPAVTRAAFRSLRQQSLDDGEWESLAEGVEAGRTTGHAYSALMDLLETRPDCGTARTARMAQAVLDHVANTDGNRELRARAAQLLE